MTGGVQVVVVIVHVIGDRSHSVIGVFHHETAVLGADAVGGGSRFDNQHILRLQICGMT